MPKKPRIIMAQVDGSGTAPVLITILSSPLLLSPEGSPFKNSNVVEGRCRYTSQRELLPDLARETGARGICSGKNREAIHQHVDSAGCSKNSRGSTIFPT